MDNKMEIKLTKTKINLIWVILILIIISLIQVSGYLNNMTILIAIERIIYPVIIIASLMFCYMLYKKNIEKASKLEIIVAIFMIIFGITIDIIYLPQILLYIEAIISIGFLNFEYLRLIGIFILNYTLIQFIIPVFFITEAISTRNLSRKKMV